MNNNKFSFYLAKPFIFFNSLFILSNPSETILLVISSLIFETTSRKILHGILILGNLWVELAWDFCKTELANTLQIYLWNAHGND